MFSGSPLGGAVIIKINLNMMTNMYFSFLFGFDYLKDLTLDEVEVGALSLIQQNM